MSRNFLCSLTAAALLLGAGALLVHPLDAAAQQPESELSFKRRMESRIDTILMTTKSLQRKLEGDPGDDGRRRDGSYDTMSGVGAQLEAVDEQCRKLKRELQRTTFGTTYDIFRQQQQIEYQVMGMEYRLRDIRKYLRQTEEEQRRPEDADPQPEFEEDDMSDEDWAADWAKGNQ